MKKFAIISLVLLMFVVSACGFPTPSANKPTTSPEELQTQVAMVLTSQPSPTLPVVATDQPKSAATPQATETGPLVVTKPAASETSLPTEQPQAEQPTATLQPEGESPTAAPETPAETPTPEATLAPTTTPLPTATLPAGDPKLNLGAPIYSETFDEDNGSWPTGEDASKFTSAEISGGAFKVTSLQPKDGWRLTWEQPENFYLEASLKTTTCSGGDRYGLIFRVPNLETADAGYLFGLTCDGQYSLRRWDGKKMTHLITWKEDKAINKGSHQTNRLGVMAKKNTIAVYVNGVLLGEVWDHTITEGAFGVFVGYKDTKDMTIIMDEISYWELP